MRSLIASMRIARCASASPRASAAARRSASGSLVRSNVSSAACRRRSRLQSAACIAAAATSAMATPPVASQAISSAEISGTSLRELVADAPDGLDEIGVGRVALDLVAQAVDVRVDGVLVAAVAVAPDLVEQLCAREDAPRAAREVDEQLELLGREFHGATGDARLVALDVDRQALELDHRCRRRSRGGRLQRCRLLGT